LIKQINAELFKNMILSSSERLEQNKEVINDLNVFPVPDGDTGTNMGLTMTAACVALKDKNFESVSDCAETVASAVLRGARGNSGVILSLMFRGISKGLRGLEFADSKSFAAALKNGVDSAYKAVMKPAEGTILTVSRVAASAAIEFAESSEDIELMLSSALESAQEALMDTINLNPVLKRAGVVDAGGKGFVCILEAMLSVVQGNLPTGKEPGVDLKDSGKAQFSVFADEEITFTYDTVFIVNKFSPDTDIRSYCDYLGTIGDSLIVNEADDIFKVHVHTDVPGEVLSKALAYGTLEKADIENMRSQHDELTHAVQDVNPLSRQESLDATKRYGVVVVSAGDGLASIFTELRADRVVKGGQTMNPSTADILDAINKTPAETVFVLPNNKNIIMAAEQCSPLTDKNVIVIPTRTEPQGIAALISFDENLDTEELEDEMRETIKHVHTVHVTYAARDSTYDGHSIKAGQYLSLLDGALLGSFSSKEELNEQIASEISGLDSELITIYYGEDVSEEEAEELAEFFREEMPDSEVGVERGGQPVYYYIISAE
jgi:DAK2 domain fusion protein YloV